MERAGGEEETMGISHAVRTPREASAARARWQIIRGRDATAGYLMIAPAAIILIVLIAYPFGLSLWLSMTNRTIGNNGHFVGLANFRNQLDSQIFRTAFRNTVWYTFVTTIIKTILGFALALLLNQ